MTTTGEPEVNWSQDQMVEVLLMNLMISSRSVRL